MKQQLTEATEGEHCNECGRLYGDTVYSVPDSVWAVIHERAPAGLLCPTCALDRLARLVERLLPGECSDHSTKGKVDLNEKGLGVAWSPCPNCHSDSAAGEVWDEGIVEAVAKAIFDDNSMYKQPDQLARAVLSALVELLTEKVGSQ